MKKIIIIFFVVILAVIAFFLLKSSEFYKKIYTPNLLKNILKPKDTYNVLLFGYGGGKHEGAFLTDTIMLLHVDLTTKKAVLFSIPRDLWVKLPTKSGATFHLKINALYQLELGEIGDVSNLYPDLDQSHFGAQNDAEYTKYILAQTLNLPVDNYVAIDFDGFKKAIDVLGGVDVNVLRGFDDPEYPIDGKETDLCGNDEKFKKIEPFLKPGYDPKQREAVLKDPKLDEFLYNATQTPELAFPCRYETLHFIKGLTHMDGEAALKYVRSRHSLQEGGDFGRSLRQQQLLQAVKDKVLSIGFVPKILPLLDELSGHVRTDFSLSDMKRFIGFAGTAKDYKLVTYVISDQNLLIDSWSDDGQSILIPKEGVDQWDNAQFWIKNIMEGVLPTPIPTATPSGIVTK